jgi:predicted PurR-regulated permease PerM
VWVLFAILAFGHLLGFVGVLLAVPLAAVVLVLVRHLKRRYEHSGLYKD